MRLIIYPVILIVVVVFVVFKFHSFKERNREKKFTESMKSRYRSKY